MEVSSAFGGLVPCSRVPLEVSPQPSPLQTGLQLSSVVTHLTSSLTSAVRYSTSVRAMNIRLWSFSRSATIRRAAGLSRPSSFRYSCEGQRDFSVTNPNPEDNASGDQSFGEEQKEPSTSWC